MNEYLYNLELVWKEKKIGELKVNGFPDIEVSAPVEFDGKPGTWTPEHLFVASVASCFMTTFVSVARTSRLEFRELKIVATGKLTTLEGKKWAITEITIKPTLTVSENDKSRVHLLIEKAHENCLIANSMKTSVKIEPEIIVE